MPPLAVLTLAAPLTPVSVTVPEAADTDTSPAPVCAMVMLPEPLLAAIAPATAKA